MASFGTASFQKLAIKATVSSSSKGSSAKSWWAVNSVSESSVTSRRAELKPTQTQHSCNGGSGGCLTITFKDSWGSDLGVCGRFRAFPDFSSLRVNVGWGLCVAVLQIAHKL